MALVETNLKEKETPISSLFPILEEVPIPKDEEIRILAEENADEETPSTITLSFRHNSIYCDPTSICQEFITLTLLKKHVGDIAVYCPACETEIKTKGGPLLIGCRRLPYHIEEITNGDLIWLSDKYDLHFNILRSWVKPFRNSLQKIIKYLEYRKSQKDKNP